MKCPRCKGTTYRREYDPIERCHYCVRTSDWEPTGQVTFGRFLRYYWMRYVGYPIYRRLNS